MSNTKDKAFDLMLFLCCRVFFKSLFVFEARLYKTYEMIVIKDFEELADGNEGSCSITQIFLSTQLLMRLIFASQFRLALEL